ncbi:MAG: DMT family transporter [Rhodobacter sp.]|jgi:drug/metabolite transporter (DMT)-like permease|nr:DMT family transporter [Rhodobacter sp.]
MKSLMPATRGHLAMLIFSALVAGSFSLGGMIANEIAPAALNALRFLLAGLIMGALVLATGGIPRAALRAPWRYLVLGGLFSAYFVLMFEGLKTAPPVSAAAVFTLTPIVTAGFGWLLLRQITTPRMALALSIGAAGALWVIFRAELAALLAFKIGRGEAIYFIGCVFHAAFTPMLKLLNRGERSLVYSFLFMVAGFVLLTLWGWGDLMATDWASLPALVWVTLFYLAIFASAGSFFMLQYAARVLPSAKVMAYTYLTPAWVLCWEIALGHGVPPLLVLVGIALTAVALWLLLKDEG